MNYISQSLQIEPSPVQNKNNQQNKQASILFCDIVEYTQRTLDHAPEEIAADIQVFQDICQQSAEKFSGKIAAFAGDGTMIVFGHPHTNEHDAVNAIYCALCIKHEIEKRQSLWLNNNKKPLQIRIAIDTSLICFTEPTRAQQPLGESMFGIAPNLAARLQKSANTWQILVSPNTFALTHPYFEFEKLPKRTLKGFPQPVNAWRVIEEKPPITTPHLIHHDYFADFVGRQTELNKLNEIVSQLHLGEPKFILISGEKGIGKTRLLHEFYQNLNREQYYQVHIHSSTPTQNIPFAPIIREVYRWYRLQPSDPIMRKQILLTQALSVQGITDHQSLALFFELMSVPLPRHIAKLDFSKEQKYQFTLDLLSELLFRMTKQRPVVLIVDQLESTDNATRDWLHNVSQKAHQLNLMVIACSRQNQDIHLLNETTQHIELPPFNTQASHNLINNILHGRQYKGFELDRITTLCDGVPLFLEETCWNILWHVKQGELNSYKNLEDLPIPSLLNNIFNLGIDKLQESADLAKLIAAFAMPVPKHFLSPLTTRLNIELEDNLAKLLKQKVLYIDKQGNYCFSRKLFACALYRSQSEHERQYIHELIANYLSQTQKVHFSKKIAMHYSKANKHKSAAVYWLYAVKDFLERHRFKDAYQACEKGLESLSLTAQSNEQINHHDNNKEIELELTLNQIYCSWYVDRRKGHNLYSLKRCANLANNLNKPAVALKAYCLQTLYQITLSQSNKINAGLLKLKRSEKSIQSYASIQLIASAKFFSGEHEKAMQMFHHCRQLTIDAVLNNTNCDIHLYALSVAFDAINSLLLNHKEKAQSIIDNLTQNLSLLSPAHKIEALLGMCIYYQLLSQYSQCEQLSSHALDLATQYEMPGLKTAAQIFSGFSQIMLNQDQSKLIQLEKNIRHCQAYFGFTLTAYMTLLLAIAKAKCGDLLQADISASDAIEIGKTTSEKWMLPIACKTRGDIAKANSYSQHEFTSHYNQSRRLAKQNGSIFFLKSL